MEEQKNWWRIYGAILTIVILLVGIALVWGKRGVAAYYVTQGQKLYTQGEYPAARARFKNALRFDRTEPRAQFFLGKIALGKPTPGATELYPDADYTEASTHFELALKNGLEKKSRELYTEALNDLGFVYWTANNRDRADELFKKRIELAPSQSYVARFLLATDYYDRLNQPSEAFGILERAPDNASLPIHQNHLFITYSRLARLAFLLGKSEKAVEFANLAISKAPENSRTDANVRVAYIIRGFSSASNKKIDQAVGDIDHATTLATEIGLSKNLYRCAMAKTYFLSENFQRAIEIAKPHADALSEFNRQDVICLDILGRAYHATGNQKDARIYAEKYIAATNSFEMKDVYIMTNRSFLQAILTQS